MNNPTRRQKSLPKKKIKSKPPERARTTKEVLKKTKPKSKGGY